MSATGPGKKRLGVAEILTTGRELSRDRRAHSFDTATLARWMARGG